jgi:glycine dehydrogenase
MTFASRHIGPDPDEQTHMLKTIGYASLDALMDAAIPEVIRWHGSLDLPPAASEEEAIAELRAIAGQNTVATSMIGLGYYGTVTPAVIRRNVLENPAWYTAYTPYQPEISQGRLEALLNFQTMVTDLTGLATANASMLDEGTAVAEAMTLARRASKVKSSVYAVDADTLPQTLAVLRTRAEPLGIEIVLVSDGELPAEFFGLHLQYPGASGAVRDHAELVAAAHAKGALVTVAADLLALTLLRAPGEIGADIAAGTTQRFGVPLGFGGPHAGYLAVRAGLERSLPGRLVGVSKDADGAPAYRLALQTREQHIRREKATSNICTAQVLLAVMASMYAVYHGPDGLRAIARRVHGHALAVAGGLAAAGVEVAYDGFFDTVTAVVPGRAESVVAAAAESGVDLRLVSADRVSIACDETTTAAQVAAALAAFGATPAAPAASGVGALARTSDFLTHPVFRTHHSETSMLRYLRRLSDRDYALDRGMIPLGSCTMKLNATTEMEPVSWPEFANIHPYAPASQTVGYERLVAQLEGWLAEITGYDAVSVQPNAGSQGELAPMRPAR